MNRGRIIVLVVGIIGLLVSIGLLTGGGTLLWINNAHKDSDGFYCTQTIRIEKDSYAIVAEPDNIDMQGGWDWPWGYGFGDLGDLTAFRVEGSSNNPSNQIFIGVATASEIDDYLSSVELDEVTSLHIIPSSADYRNHPGSAIPGDPTSQTLWADSTYGTGTQILEWELEPGNYSLVLMNSDASAGIDMNIVVGAKIPLLLEGMAEFFLFGGAFLFAGILLIYLSMRRRSTVPSESPEAPPLTENEGEKPYE